MIRRKKLVPRPKPVEWGGHFPIPELGLPRNCPAPARCIKKGAGGKQYLDFGICLCACGSNELKNGHVTGLCEMVTEYCKSQNKARRAYLINEGLL